ncbi:MAG: hypothetical protein ACPGN3_03540 [Opitutales bacterium]
MFKILTSAAFSTLLTASLLVANNNERNWHITDGGRVFAELISFDEEANQIILQAPSREKTTWRLEDFSPIDQAWLVEWLEINERLQAMLAGIDGRYTHKFYQGKLSDYDIHCYEPSSSIGTANRPLMFLLSAGPKGSRYLLRHIEAAEATGLVIVSVDNFGNTRTSDESERQYDKFREVLPVIETLIPHEPKNLFIGGTSGGALRAVRISNRVERPWKGIYWNGGWLGNKDYLDEYYQPIKYAIVNGNNDRAANGYLKRDIAILEKNGGDIAIMSFEGGHQIPPYDSQVKAFSWLLGIEGVDEISPK